MTTLLVRAPLAGVVVALADVPDPVFGAQLVGPGLAIDPALGGEALEGRADDGDVRVVAPVDGTVTAIHPHAFVVACADGRAVLVHLGVDTVQLRGAGFTVLAGAGDAVRAGAVVVTWRPADVAAGGFALDVVGDAMRAMRAATPITDLARVAAPVRLVNGRWDHFRGDERRFLAACRDGRLSVVPRATHLVSLVQPVRFTRVLLDVLDDVDAREASAVGTRQLPGAHAADDAGLVGHHDDVVPEPVERGRRDAS